MMPKLFQWLSAASLFLSLWLAVILEYYKTDFTSQHHSTILLLPLYLVVVFGCYSITVVLYRVATFNNCDAASEELQQQIKDARTDLTKKGFKFSES